MKDTQIIPFNRLFVAVIAMGIANTTLGGEKPRKTVESLKEQPEELRVIVLNLNSIPLLDPSDGKRKNAKVILTSHTYEAVVRKKSGSEWSGTLLCYELCSENPHLEYIKRVWSHHYFSHFRLFSNGKKESYLAWVDWDWVIFKNVADGDSGNLMASLNEYLAVRGPPHKHMIRVSKLAGKKNFQGLDARNADIDILSIKKEKNGEFHVKVRGPRSKKVFEFVGTGTKWRLLPDSGKESIANTTLGGEEPRKTIESLMESPKKSRVIALNLNSIPLVDPSDGKRKDAKVILTSHKYMAIVRKKSRSGGSWPLCYELCSEDPRLGYVKQVWNDFYCAHFRLFSNGEKESYLAWVDGDGVVFKNVADGDSGDLMASLNEYLNTGDRPDRHVLRISKLVGKEYFEDFRNFQGLDARNADIDILSVKKDKDGDFRVKVRGPRSKKVFEFVGAGTKWRLLADSGK